ncbi:hypothetical protein ACIRPP_08825 [Streptomyces sp. NPDC101219]|uniref:hypothetical protein n=1 Tax=Streptomyces sp. NPDC101219 TaxID=3366131 RepID=UPI003816D1BB
MHLRGTAVVATAVLAVALTACSSDDSPQGEAQRATATVTKSVSGTPDCGPGSALSQAEWMEQCDGSPSAAPSSAQPGTELSVGDTFAYTDSLKVRVDSITRLTRFGEWDSRPEAGQTAFRVTCTVTNGTDAPYDLDRLATTTEGGTTGGETTLLSVEGAKDMTGRLAPGRSGTFHDDRAIAESDAGSIVVTVSRFDSAWVEQGDAWPGEDPHWTGPIE